MTEAYVHVRLRRVHLLQLGLSPEQRTYAVSARHMDLKSGSGNARPLRSLLFGSYTDHMPSEGDRNPQA